MIESTDAETIFARRSVNAETIGPSLSTKDGKVVLVGDAAHAMSNSYGQNPNFALEGAAELATCIRNHPDSVEAALEEYERARVGRCTEMQKRSAERAAKAMKGDRSDDVSPWVHSWNIM